MSSDLTFTGERFLPSCTGEIAYEHWHRYAFARLFVAGQRVLDAACGEGYGTALLGAVAASAVGADIDGASIAHASVRYGDERVRFVQGSCTQLPLHLEAADQPRMLSEFARVLKPDGLLVISSPNKRLYSDARNYANEFHRHELYRDEFAALLGAAFAAQRWYHQRLGCWSGIWSEEQGAGVEAWIGEADQVRPYPGPEGMYFVVVAARSNATLPPPAPRVSLFADVADSEFKRSEASASEVLRLDGLLRDRDAALDRQTAHIAHLEALVAERERIIVERDAQLHECAATIAALEKRNLALENQMAVLETRVAAAEAESARLTAALAAQERIIAYRQSLRWWIRLPWFRLKRRFARG